jgi:hypothetical protein
MTPRFPVVAGVLIALVELAMPASGIAQEPTRFAVELELGPVWQSSNDVQSITAGYRTVEGGADTDDVYAFAWFHYAVVSAIYRF